MIFWIKISYIAQLIGSSLVYMLPIQKRRIFSLRALLGAIILLGLSYLANSFIVIPESMVGSLLYWAFFPVVMVPYIYFCADVTVKEAAAAVAFTCASQHVACNIYIIYELYCGKNFIVFALMILTFYSLFYLFVARKLAKNGHYIVSRLDLFPMVSILFFVIVLSVVQSFVISAPVGKTIYYLCDVLCCIYILLEQIVQREKLDLQHELDSLTYLWKKQKDQYAVTQETIEIINRKCHDLKHQIHAILNTGAQKDRDDYLKEIDKAVEIYDTAVSTGNTALDTVLMEKGLCCRMHDIQWTCMVDGACLDNIDPADLYAMFGNALDNAITAVMPIQDVNKRIISVTQSIQGDLSVVQVRNYYEGALCFENGLPRTSRQNREKHGYGMKSMRYTAEKYGGSINVDGSGQIFTLSILLPMSHRKERAS